jgi:leucine dehydrogenase
MSQSANQVLTAPQDYKQLTQDLQNRGRAQLGTLSVEKVDTRAHHEHDGHEAVYRITDPSVGLVAFVGVHNTNLGPAMGGTRLWAYATQDQALTDVLRLSKGMTYKSALAGLPLGGGKAVIMASVDQKTPALLTSYANALNIIGGQYLTAADVNTNQHDMDVIQNTSPFVAGVTVARGGRGDPSDATAYGVFRAVQATIEHKFGRSDMTGLRVAIQGLGSVGYDLAKQLKQVGCELVVADVNAARVQQAATELGAKVVDVSDIHRADCDLFSPCALGAILNEQSIPEMKAAAICGGANNQLKVVGDGERLVSSQKLYAPDYAANAGGIIKVCAEYLKWDVQQVNDKVARIKDTLSQIYQTAQAQSIRPEQAADQLAKQAFMKQA